MHTRSQSGPESASTLLPSFPRFCCLLLSCLLLGSWGLPARADEALGEEIVIPAESATETDAAIADPPEEKEIVLSLSQAIDNALVNNLDLELSRYAPELALARWKEAHGVYDPDFFANYGYSSATSPSSFAFDASAGLPVIDTRKRSGGTGISGEIPFIGARYGIKYGGSQAVTTGTANVLLKPENRSGVEATLSIPLLRDLIWNQSWTQIQSRKLEHRATNEEFRRSMMDIVNETERAYWNLIATREKTRVDRKSLETTQALYEQTQTQFEVGTVSKVEVVEAEAGVAEREVNVITSENAYRTAQDDLIYIITGARLTATTDLRVTASDELENVEIRDLDVGASMNAALLHRPELSAANLLVEERGIQQKFARNQKLPRFDIDSSYGREGLTGEARDGTDFGDYLDTHDEYDDHESWSTMGTFSIPLGNRVASERLTQAEIELRKARTEYTRTQQDIVVEIR
ncbi:MAG: TolC family protein, partial [Deltaproteobacteria bacterium]|nr:TolC family protein [Deltaproteobacteria bacterium]